MGELVAPFHDGHLKKEPYAYAKNGSCALLAAIEPLTGQRFALVLPQRTQKEYREFCQALVAAYPDAVKIQLVQDNLNTHNASAFYEHLPAEEAFALAQKIEFHYTPKSASWLNMIDIEFSALARQCLDRRIATMELLKEEVLTLVNGGGAQSRRTPISWWWLQTTTTTKGEARPPLWKPLVWDSATTAKGGGFRLVKERSEKKIKIHWQFSLETARTKLNRHYEKVNANNSKYKKT